ncbi:MAG: RNA 2',3'-cyclic phosphodiesterase [Coriobacteriia bacterium]
MIARGFVAIDLPSAGRDLLVRARRELSRAAAAWEGERWVDPANLHVTLRFLGPLDDTAQAAVIEALASLCPRTNAFDARVSGIVPRPSARSATMLWATFREEDLPRFSALASALEDELLRRGIPAEGRPYVPHVTLVRARRRRSLSRGALDAANESIERADAAARTVSVRTVTLYSSTLTPRGPVYEAIASGTLGG